MVLIFSAILILGIISGQVIDFSGIREVLTFITSVCLAYIMIEVGLEFSLEKKSIRSYEWDFLVAFSAAVLPALLCFGYFIFVIHGNWREAALSGLSSAPTSAGVLFSMMMAAGLSATWVFKKARVLAVLDDLVTILLLVPLEIIVHGFEWSSIISLVVVTTLLFAAFRWQNTVKWPLSKIWLLIYGVILAALLFVIRQTTHLHLEILIPAFMWGCIIHPVNFHDEPAKSKLSLDTVIKGLFMFLVGLSFPKVAMGGASISATVGHVLILTILANLGKMIPALCYRKEASLKERLALSVAMFPRGEVGAAVLLIALGYGLSGYANTLALLSLALNLVMTGGFIWIVIRLLRR
jgi:Kef-type K+ transport system membrane component KefB